MAEDFDRGILSLAESLFDEGQIETLVGRRTSSSNEHSTHSPIKVIHKPTETEVVCDTFSTQIQNKAAALLRLRRELDNRAAS